MVITDEKCIDVGGNYGDVGGREMPYQREKVLFANFYSFCDGPSNFVPFQNHFSKKNRFYKIGYDLTSIRTDLHKEKFEKLMIICLE